MLVASPKGADNRLEAGVKAGFDRVVADVVAVIDAKSAILGGVEPADTSARNMFLGYSFAWGGKFVEASGFHLAPGTVETAVELITVKPC